MKTIFTSLKNVSNIGTPSCEGAFGIKLFLSEIFLKNTYKKIKWKPSILFFLVALPGLYSYCQSGDLIFKGGFENGIIASKGTPGVWQRYSPGNVVPDDHRWRLDSMFVHQGQYSLRIELRPGDTTNAYSDRAELVGLKDSLGNRIVENGMGDSVKYYACSIKLDSNWIPPGEGSILGGSHGTFLQLHKMAVNNIYDSTKPTFTFQVTKDFHVSQHTGNIDHPDDTRYELTDNRLNAGTWIDFVVKIKYSIDSTGEIIIWRRNEGETLFTRVLHVVQINTLLYQVTDNIKKALDHDWHTGYYRSRQLTDGNGITNILWLDGFTIAKTAAAAQFNAFNSTVVDLPGDDSSCAPPIIADSVNNVTCKGTKSGSVFLSSYMDISQDSIRWTGPDDFSASTQNITNVGAGVYTYTLTSTEPAGCITTKDITITEPDSLLAQVNYAPILCRGGTTLFTISASGGTLPYKGINTYTKGACDYSYIVTDKNGCADTASGTIIEPLALVGVAVVDSSIKCFGGTTTIAVSGTGGTWPYTGTGHFVGGIGTYTYPIEDSSGCRDTVNFVLKKQPDSLVLVKDIETMVSCKGRDDGSIKLNVNGGTKPYLYSFNGGVKFFRDSLRPNLAPGNYSIAFSDSNGCVKHQDNTILITEPDSLLAQVNYAPVLCKGDTTLVTISATGGVLPYKGTNTYIKRAGDYSFIVGDKNGCADTVSGTIIEPLVLTGVAVMDSSIKCFGSTTTITVSATGGTWPYSGTGNFVGGVGTYSYPIADANGCLDTVDFVLKKQPDSLVLTKDVETMVSCNGGIEGSIRLVVNGGTWPYQYSFDGGITFQSDSLKTGLPAGNYSIAFSDANGCINYQSKRIKITEPLALSSTECYTASTHILHAVGTGGTSPYNYSLRGTTYKLSNAADGGRDFSLRREGTFTVYVKDKNNCVSMQTVTTSSLPECIAPSPLKDEITTQVMPAFLNARVSPNPSNANFNLIVKGTENKPITIKVYDMYGRMIYTQEGSLEKNYSFGQTFVPGVYILQIIQGHIVKSLKIVKL